MDINWAQKAYLPYDELQKRLLSQLGKNWVTQLAAVLGKTPQTILNWKKKGIPKEWICVIKAHIFETKEDAAQCLKD